MFWSKETSAERRRRKIREKQAEKLREQIKKKTAEYDESQYVAPVHFGDEIEVKELDPNDETLDTIEAEMLLQHSDLANATYENQDRDQAERDLWTQANMHDSGIWRKLNKDDFK